MTKKELLEAIKDMPEDAEVWIRCNDGVEGKVIIDNIQVENHKGYNWRCMSTIIIDEI